MAGFEEAIRRGSLILTDGGIETRLMFEAEVELPAHVQVAALVDDPVGGAGVHPSVVSRVLRGEAGSSGLVGRRLLEFKANASPLSTQDLVRLDHLEGDDPERFAAEMWEIHEDFGLPVLGGCCGTDDRHMRALAARMAPTGSGT